MSTLFRLALAVALGWAVVKLVSPDPRVPPLTITTTEGRTLALDRLHGKPLLVTFWATTCPACVQEIPQLTALYQELNPRGLEIIAIAMPFDPPNYVLHMVNNRRIPYAVAVDPEATAVQAFGSIHYTPTSFLISPRGRIVRRHVGMWDADELRSLILKML